MFFPTLTPTPRDASALNWTIKPEHPKRVLNLSPWTLSKPETLVARFVPHAPATATSAAIFAAPRKGRKILLGAIVMLYALHDEVPWSSADEKRRSICAGASSMVQVYRRGWSGRNSGRLRVWRIFVLVSPCLLPNRMHRHVPTRQAQPGAAPSISASASVPFLTSVEIWWNPRTAPHPSSSPSTEHDTKKQLPSQPNATERQSHKQAAAAQPGTAKLWTAPTRCPNRRFLWGRVYARRCPSRASPPLPSEELDRLRAKGSVELIWGLWVVVCATRSVRAWGANRLFAPFFNGARESWRSARAGSLGHGSRVPGTMLWRKSRKTAITPSRNPAGAAQACLLYVRQCSAHF